MNVIVSNNNQGLLSTIDVDIIKSINGEFTPEELVSTFSNFFFNRMFLDITAIKDYKDISNIQKLSMNFDMDKVIFLLNDSIMADKEYISKLISIGVYNFGTTKESLMYLYNHPNTYKDVANYHQIDESDETNKDNSEKKGKFFNIGVNLKNDEQESSPRTSKVIGFINVTSGAGATTLIYMLKKVLSEKEYVVAIEVNKNDFGFFDEKNMYSVNQNNLNLAINKFNDASVVLVDLNNASNSELCDEIIYLIEPSTIKLNKMMLINKNIFDKIYGKKIVLNKSLLKESDIKEFELESNTKIFFNIPPLNDRNIDKDVLEAFINEL